jgi:hypothetical protein
MAGGASGKQMFYVDAFLFSQLSWTVWPNQGVFGVSWAFVVVMMRPALEHCFSRQCLIATMNTQALLPNIGA